jgi:hypothetical protein
MGTLVQFTSLLNLLHLFFFFFSFFSYCFSLLVRTEMNNPAFL